MTVAQINRHIAAERELARKLEEYAGQWVAVADHQIVAAAETAEQLLEQTDGQHIDRYFRVTTGASLL